MFTKSKNSQGDLFSGMTHQLSERKNKLLNDSSGWHSVFWKEVTSRIDEKSYSVLYNKTQGRPNASVRVLIAMMILKEGNGWSDAQLFDESRFNLKVMYALGFANLDEDIPVESTYYEFRRLVGEHKKNKGINLIEGTFKQITADQIKSFNISGKKIRLDSKLIQSNIAHSTRLHLILEAIRVSIVDMDISSLDKILSEDQYWLLTQLKEKTTSNITYTLDNKGEQEVLKSAGYVIRAILDMEGGINEDSILGRIYNEQYDAEQEIKVNNKSGNGDKDQTGEELSDKEEDKPIKPKSPKEIQSNSVQSIHDPQAAYRKKGKGHSTQTVSGYHANITETCDKQDVVNLICSVEVQPANVCENEFLLPAITAAEQILPKQEDQEQTKIEEVITDGGYDSVTNRKAMSKLGKPKWSLAKLKGRKRAYHMKYKENAEVVITNAKTSEPYEVKYIEKKEKYRIRKENGTYRYWTKQEIQNYIDTQSILENYTKESYNLRANVESTIHQVFHRVKNRQKIQYRGITKSHWYVLSRALWVNATRIGKHLQEKSIKTTIYVVFTICSIMKPDRTNEFQMKKIYFRN
jgi:hypothetical protein